MAKRNYSRRNIVGSLAAVPLTGLAACAAPSQLARMTRNDADVIVIGAGLAGLHAAYLLENAGQKVMIVEGNDRTGGRLHTLDNLPGAPDAGGIQVGASYQRFNAIADRLNVERYLPDESIGGYLYDIRGASMLAKDWPGHPKNMLSPAEQKTEPASLLFATLRGLPKLADIADWMDSTSAAIDVPLGQWLRANGASNEAIRLINTNLNGDTLASMSALHMQRTLAMYGAAAKADPGPTKFVRGGSQRMTDAMTARLKSDILLNTPVMGIRENADHVEVALADGRKLRASQVVCTAPLTVLRDMKIDTALPIAARTAISKLPYTKASFVFLRTTDAFWLNDGLPEYIWSDDPLLGRVFTLNGDAPLLKIWTNGPAAQALDQMDQKDAAAQIISRIETIRPSARGKLSYLDSFSWQKQPFARGIYHHIGVGTGAPLAALVRHEGKRLHFAGEHMTQLAPGMEGALESAERVSARILATA